MGDLFLGIADPEFWRNCGYALLAIGLIGAVAVILLLDRKPRLQKGLALLSIAVVLAGLGVIDGFLKLRSRAALIASPTPTGHK